MAHLKQKYGLLIIGIIVGILYGLLTRYIFGIKGVLSSITYLFIVPIVLGIIPLMFANNEQLKSYRKIIFIPWLTVGAFFLTTLAMRIEDIGCLIILGMPFFILGTVGALIYRFIEINKDKNKGKLLSLILLPFLLSPIEEYIKSPSEKFTIQSVVIISSTSEIIWNNVVEVKSIQPSEYNSGFFNWMGIPRPIRASVTQRELGAERIGEFEGGLRFVEDITKYQLNKVVAFDIKVDAKTIRSTALDQHVLNGNYFTFVDATYEIQPQKDGQFQLVLSSSYQLTSKVNFYGKFWGDMILKDFQDRLLAVIKLRCEKAV